MFENIIGQPNVVRTLQSELVAGTLPASVLLHGPPYSGKLSAALETARVLTCHGGGEWSCGCPSCRKHRLLLHPNTIMMGFRDFEPEIAASADTLRRNRRTASRYLFVRAVRKLTRRFDPLLWEGEDTRVRGLQPVLAEVEERLDGLLADGGDRDEGDRHEGGRDDAGLGPEGKKLERQLQKIRELCGRLLEALSAETIPISQIRRAASWLHMTALNVPACSSGAARKVLILENVDRMHEPSGNSLLKLLEEPPQDAYLILITTRPGALIPTVRSRLRSYPFTERSREAEEEVLKRIFHEEGQDYQGLREYFLFWKDINPQALRGLARRFVEGVLASAVESEEEPGAGGILEDLEKAVKAGAGKSRTERAFASSFFEELLRQLHLLLREGALDSFRLERWNQAIREHLYALQRFNQQPMLTLESLYYTLRAAE